MDRHQMISILRSRGEIYQRLERDAADAVAAETFRRLVEEDHRDIRELEDQLAAQVQGRSQP